MTNDQKISTIAKLLREMSDEFGGDFSVGVYRKGELFYEDRYGITVNGAHGSDTDPMNALTEALVDAERKADERAIEAQVRAEVQARMAERKAA